MDIDSHKILVISIPPHNRLVSLSKNLQLKNNTSPKGTTYYRIGEEINVASPDVIEDFNKAFKKSKEYNLFSIFSGIRNFLQISHKYKVAIIAVFLFLIVFRINYIFKKEIVFNKPNMVNFPIKVKRHLNQGLVGFGKGECPIEPYKSGYEMVLKIFINPNVSLDKLTPAIIQMIKINSPNHHSQIFSQQFELHSEANNFLITAPREQGMYLLEGGFFVKNDLKDNLPIFHAIRCPINIGKENKMQELSPK